MANSASGVSASTAATSTKFGGVKATKKGVRLSNTTKRHLTEGPTAGLMAHHRERPLTVYEKKFLLCVERGDTVSVRTFLNSHQNLVSMGKFSIDCHDPLGRTALILAIENENMDMMELLLSSGASLGDALLHAISEEYVEAVEALLKHEEQIHQPGTPYSWEQTDSFSSVFTRDISPLILAAHKNNYEILKLLLDRGAAIPLPHDAKCSCKDCLIESKSDYLRHSRARINAYRALASPSLIALSSRDPILTAFQLSWELRRLSRIEKEFAIEYKQLREQVQTFAVNLLDHIRTSQELRIVLNCHPLWFNASVDDEDGQTGRQTGGGGGGKVDCLSKPNDNMDRIKLAIEFKQKQFVAHPSVQQVLGSVWYSGLDDFGRKGPFIQLLIVIWMAILFPIHSIALLVAPSSKLGIRASKPFIQFISHSASYLLFLFLLVLESQRIESLLVTQLIDPTFIPNWVKFLHESSSKTGPNLPNVTQCLIILYVLGFFLQQLVQLSTIGLVRYFNDLWNLVDTLINLLYFFWLLLRLYTIVQVYFIEPSSFASSSSSSYSPSSPSILRQSAGIRGSFFTSSASSSSSSSASSAAAGSSSSTWPNFREPFFALDSSLLEELSTSMFAAASICSFLKLVHIFSVHPHLGPLQISLGRMVFDILKFFFIYTWILFAFACGLYHLLSNYSAKDADRCIRGQFLGISPFDHDHSCSIWRRFANLFETTQTLFWASFGLIDLSNFEFTGIKEFTRFWSLLMFGLYSIINVVVLLNLLIAMMSDSYQVISTGRDTEWKFARSKLWISYFTSGENNLNRYPSSPFNLFIPLGWFLQVIYYFIKRITKCCILSKRVKGKNIKKITKHRKHLKDATGSHLDDDGNDDDDEADVVDADVVIDVDDVDKIYISGSLKKDQLAHRFRGESESIIASSSPSDINCIEKGGGGGKGGRGNFNKVPRGKVNNQMCNVSSLDGNNVETMGDANCPSYHQVIRGLVRRYVIREQRKTEETGPVTEDDVKEVKQDIATFKFQLFDLLKRNGFKMTAGIKGTTSRHNSHDPSGALGRLDSESDDMSMVDSATATAISRKDRTRERRLLRGFSIGLVQSGHQQQQQQNKHPPSTSGPGIGGGGGGHAIHQSIDSGREVRRKPISMDTITMDIDENSAVPCATGSNLGGGGTSSRRSSLRSLFKRQGSKEKYDSIVKKELAQKRWTFAITAVVESSGNPIGSIESMPSEVKSSLKDLRTLVLEEKELADVCTSGELVIPLDTPKEEEEEQEQAEQHQTQKLHEVEEDTNSVMRSQDTRVIIDPATLPSDLPQGSSEKMQKTVTSSQECASQGEKSCRL